MSDFDLQEHLTKTRRDGKVLGLMEAQAIVLQYGADNPDVYGVAKRFSDLFEEAIAEHDARSAQSNGTAQDEANKGETT